MDKKAVIQLQAQIEKGQVFDTSNYVKPLVEMADIWNPEKYQGLDLDIYSSEGKVDHFHLKGPRKFFKDGTPADTCIRISKCEYFHHSHHQGLLNADGKKVLIKYLKELSKKSVKPMTHWEAVVFAWNLMNPEETNLSLTLKDMPDYRKL